MRRLSLALLLWACGGCTSELTLDPVGTLPALWAEVSIGGVELIVGTAVAVRVGEDGDPLEENLDVRMESEPPDIIGVRPVNARHTFLLYGIDAGDAALELFVDQRGYRIPARVRAR